MAPLTEACPLYSRFRLSYNRFFESASLRYLFVKGDDFKLYPQADADQKHIDSSNGTTMTYGVDGGVAGNPASAGVTPSLNFHVTSERTVEYQLSNQSSWRGGLSYERCK